MLDLTSQTLIKSSIVSIIGPNSPKISWTTTQENFQKLINNLILDIPYVGIP